MVFCFQAEKGSRYLKNALFAFCSPVPVDASAREKLLVRALYKVMQEEHYNAAYRIFEDRAAKGDGTGQ